MSRPQSMRLSERAAKFDEALIEACRRGERAALDQVLRATAPLLRRHIARHLGPSPDVDDVLQATLMAAVSAFPRFRGEARLTTWLLGIALKKIRDHLRRPQASRRIALELVPPPADPGASATERTHARRQLERLYHHLGRLSPEMRIAFVLHVLEGIPSEDVAALVGASRVATRTRISRARRLLSSWARRDPALSILFSGGEP